MGACGGEVDGWQRGAHHQRARARRSSHLGPRAGRHSGWPAQPGHGARPRAAQLRDGPDIAKVTPRASSASGRRRPPPRPPPAAIVSIQSELDRVATSLHASVADPGHLDAPVDTLTEADLTLKLTLADLQSVRDLAAKELAGVSSQLSQLASTSNRAAIAEAALKDSQQIVSRQHDALEQTSERLRLNDQQLDLMRNALHRRDELLGSQRAAFYKELLRFQAFAEHEATHARPPASVRLGPREPRLLRRVRLRGPPPHRRRAAGSKSRKGAAGGGEAAGSAERGGGRGGEGGGRGTPPRPAGGRRARGRAEGGARRELRDDGGACRADCQGEGGGAEGGP